MRRPKSTPPEKLEHQWAIPPIRQRGKFLGYVTAPDQETLSSGGTAMTMNKYLLAAALSVPPLGAHAQDISADKVHQILHVLDKAKPEAFQETRACISNYDGEPATIESCVIRALMPDEDKAADMSDEKFFSAYLAMSQARAAMSRCLEQRLVVEERLTADVWSFCIDNAGSTGGDK